MEQETQHYNQDLALSDDSVEQMLILAERLRESNGGELDESAILAVAEATGAPVEYVRLAIKLRTEKEEKSFLANIRSQFKTLEPGTRRYILSGAAATVSAMLCIMDEGIARIGMANHTSTNYGLFTMVSTISFCLGIYNVALSRDAKRAAFSGAILAGGFYLMQSLFLMLFRLPAHVDTSLFPLFSVMGASGGYMVYKLAQKYQDRLGLKDPARERSDLLKQLGELQDKLSSGKQLMTFLSVDVVGSTRMKELADPLSVEYTFNEYHEYVIRLARKYGGSLHSTAGDGIICAFESPQQAFGAYKNIQSGLLEWNRFRNRIGTPIQLRCGIHTGTVIAPSGGHVSDVNFAHVIDMAAHLQKVAPAGGVAVSEAAASQLNGGSRAVGTVRTQVLDTEVIIWTTQEARQRQVSNLAPKMPDIPTA